MSRRGGGDLLSSKPWLGGVLAPLVLGMRCGRHLMQYVPQPLHGRRVRPPGEVWWSELDQTLDKGIMVSRSVNLTKTQRTLAGGERAEHQPPAQHQPHPAEDGSLQPCEPWSRFP